MVTRVFHVVRRLLCSCYVVTVFSIVTKRLLSKIVTWVLRCCCQMVAMWLIGCSALCVESCYSVLGGCYDIPRELWGVLCY